MGAAIEREDFNPQDLERFRRRLRDSLEALKELLARPGFGAGPATLGAELEMFLVDSQGQALPYNRSVLGATRDPRVTVELNRFNIEVNARPTPLEGKSLSTLKQELEGLLVEVRRAAAESSAQVATIGILPTLTPDQLGRDAMTRKSRYKALSAGIFARREAPLQVVIRGRENLSLEWDEVTLQGANTSFQVHLRVDPRDYAAAYNAAQLAISPVLALSTNSPLFLNKDLWEETRIALFTQSVDDRGPMPWPWQSSRCGFGHGWVRDGIAELFQASVALHEPLLPVVSEEDPTVAVRSGRVPELSELKLHQSTVWTWNRAIYDAAAGGHVRIELRPLPAGPTVVDMVASAAFVLGLTRALQDDVDWMLPALPFAWAQRNFFQAAKFGLDAELLWPHEQAPSPRPTSLKELMPLLLKKAESGLQTLGVDSDERQWALGICEDRLASGMTGARWQLSTLQALEGRQSRESAIREMFREYREHSDAGAPVHLWPRR
jgi:gamma-glutamyl:cysteine ligase YbdK (ATP-grasp superfamily)